MNTQPLVSIIIPVYNGSNYLKYAIESAVTQDYKNIEVIVVNDGSNDNDATVNIINKYKDKIRYYYKTNGGVASALNLGIIKMEGYYFSWLSHDDIYDINKIKNQINHINYNNLINNIIYGNYIEIDKNNKQIRKVEVENSNDIDIYDKIYNRHIIHGCSLLIPNIVFKEVGLFDERLKTTQDYDLWLKMCRKYKFSKCNDFSVFSRQHDEQGSKVIISHKQEIRQYYRNHIDEYLNIYYKKNINEGLKKLFFYRLSDFDYSACVDIVNVSIRNKKLPILLILLIVDRLIIKFIAKLYNLLPIFNYKYFKSIKKIIRLHYYKYK